VPEFNFVSEFPQARRHRIVIGRDATALIGLPSA
jgi:hypothetical protein